MFYGQGGIGFGIVKILQGEADGASFVNFVNVCDLLGDGADAFVEVGYVRGG